MAQKETAPKRGSLILCSVPAAGGYEIRAAAFTFAADGRHDISRGSP